MSVQLLRAKHLEATAVVEAVEGREMELWQEMPLKLDF